METPVINPRGRQSRWRRHTIIGDAQQIERGARRLGKGKREAPVRSETFAFLTSEELSNSNIDGTHNKQQLDVTKLQALKVLVF